MGKRKLTYTILLLPIFVIVLIAGCASNHDKTVTNNTNNHNQVATNNNQQTVDNQQNNNNNGEQQGNNDDQKADNSGDQTTANDNQSAKGNETTNNSDNAKNNNSKNDAVKDNTNANSKNHHTNKKDHHTNKGQKDTTIVSSSQLKINKKLAKQPQFLANNKNMTTKIKVNKTNTYTLNYQKGNKQIATFSGTLYQSTMAAGNKMNKLIDGKEVPQSAKKINLGYGIYGYGEGGAGHAYLSWREGNWLLSISSLTMDQMNNPGIAKLMVKYLESNYLPPPKDKGLILVDYPQGGNSVNVTISWQENEMVYQLKTMEVPDDALRMVVSVR